MIARRVEGPLRSSANVVLDFWDRYKAVLAARAPTKSEAVKPARVDREILVLYRGDRVVRFSVPASVLLAKLDIRARSHPDSLAPAMAGAALGTLMISFPLFLAFYALLVYYTVETAESALVFSPAVWTMALVVGAFLGGPLGWWLGPRHSMAPKTFWTAEQGGEGGISSKLPSSLVSRAPALDGEKADVRTAAAMYEAIEGRDVRGMLSSREGHLNKVTVGGVAVLLISVMLVVFVTFFALQNPS